MLLLLRTLRICIYNYTLRYVYTTLLHIYTAVGGTVATAGEVFWFCIVGSPKQPKLTSKHVCACATSTPSFGFCVCSSTPPTSSATMPPSQCYYSNNRSYASAMGAWPCLCYIRNSYATAMHYHTAQRQQTSKRHVTVCNARSSRRMAPPLHCTLTCATPATHARQSSSYSRSV